MGEDRWQIEATVVEAFDRLPSSEGEAMAALARLAEAREPTAAFALLPFLWPVSRYRRHLGGWLGQTRLEPVRRTVPPELRAAAEQVLRALVMSASPDRIPDLDWSVRDMGNGSWHIVGAEPIWVTPPASAALPDDQARTPSLCLLSCHASGYVREAAVRLLARTPEDGTLAFLLWRTTDWVAQVRNAASEAVRDRLRPECVAAFAPLLTLVGHLESVRRVDPVPLVAAIHRLLLDEPGHASLVAALDGGNRQLRRAVCRVWRRAAAPPPRDVVERLCADSDGVIRAGVLELIPHMRAQTPAAAEALCRQLLRDPLPAMRLGAFRAQSALLAGEPLRALLGAGLLDSAASVRYFARFSLRALDDAADFAPIYRATLDAAGTPKALAAAIAGLGETGGADDWPLLPRFLRMTPRVARAAIGAMARLDEARSVEVLVGLLVDPRPGVRRVAFEKLPERLDEELAVLLARMWKTSHADCTRVLARSLLRLPPWPALHGLLEATLHGGPGHLAAATAALERWRPARLRSHHAVPPEHRRAELLQVFAAAQPNLPSPLADRIADVLGVGRPRIS